MGDLTKTEDARNKIFEQINLLAEWNKEHLKSEPEQCRKNLETIVGCLEKVAVIR